MNYNVYDIEIAIKHIVMSLILLWLINYFLTECFGGTKKDKILGKTKSIKNIKIKKERK